MELILQILSIILIVLLIIVAIIILILSLLLFLPIKYRISGTFEEDKTFHISVRFTYLLSILKFLLDVTDGKLHYKFKILGFEIGKEKFKPEEITFEQETESVTEPEVEFHKKSEKCETKNKEISNTITDNKESTNIGITNKEITNKEITNTEKHFQDNFLRIKKQIDDEHNKSVIQKLFNEVKYLLKHFRFRNIKSDLQFSFADPALTGQIFGILCMIPFFYQFKMKVEPDFESDHLYVKGYLFIDGKIRVIHLLKSFLKLLLDQEVRSRVKRISAK